MYRHTPRYSYNGQLSSSNMTAFSALLVDGREYMRFEPHGDEACKVTGHRGGSIIAKIPLQCGDQTHI